MPCSFQWDPNADQTFDCDVDWSLSGVAESFNKAPEKGFIMDSSAGKTLTLKPDPVATTQTTWGGTNGNAVAIDVRHGAFVYDASAGGIEALNLGWYQDADHPETRLVVQNGGQFRLNLSPSIMVWASSTVHVVLSDEALLEVNGGYFIGIPPNVEYAVEIDINQGAQFSAFCSTCFLLNGTLNVNSSPKTGYSLNWVGTGPPSPPGEIADPLSLSSSDVNFTAASTGLMGGASFYMQDTRIKAADTAVCSLQFDSIRVDMFGVARRKDSQFIIGPGSAKMLFSGYTKGTLPFDFRNKEYPKKLFNFSTSPDVLNNSEFVIRVSDGFIGNELVNKGLFAVDGELLTDSSRLKTQGELLDGYYAMTYRLKYGR
jgi:hypothetical protein